MSFGIYSLLKIRLWWKF